MICKNCGQDLMKHGASEPYVCPHTVYTPADPCKHENVKLSDIGMRDCLDCGGKEIDYQPDDDVPVGEDALERAKQFYAQSQANDSGYVSVPMLMEAFATKEHRALTAEVERLERELAEMKDYVAERAIGREG
jgi:hypothetical protein